MNRVKHGPASCCIYGAARRLRSVWSKLVETRGGLRSPAKRSALDGLMQYVAQRKELIIYPRCDQMGWDVGSGSTESMCNSMTRRLKLRGMRWDADNAEAMMASPSSTS